MSDFTDNYKFELPDFNVSTWHDAINTNFRTIDAAIKTALGFAVTKGPWNVSTAYVVGDRVFDTVEFTVYECAVNHTSASSGLFSAARAANPTYWDIVSIGLATRGDWTTATAYVINDLVYEPTEHIVALCITNHTSTTDIRTDIANWAIIADLKTSVTNAGASATNAASSASAAAGSASAASASATAADASGAAYRTAEPRRQKGLVEEQKG
jgi:hypothetical protein